MHSDHTTRPKAIKLCECGCGQPAPVAPHTDATRGWIKGQSLRFIQGHHNRMRVRPKTTRAQRLWENVQPRRIDECWEWQGHRDADGYGIASVNGKAFKAHRLAYEVNIGPIADGMLICHTCDNRACCNPHHLFEGTPADNSEDMTSKGRSAAGSRHGRTRLTEVDVIKIRQLAANGVTFVELGRRYGISDSAIQFIVKRKTWKHVP